MDFKNIDYLKYGSNIQQLAYRELSELKIMSILKEFQPVLTGTIPLDIAIPSSDLDISCMVVNHDEFKQMLYNNYAQQSDFSSNTTSKFGIMSSICSFKAQNFEIEIFGQSLRVEEQDAYRHMLIEHKILQKNNENFRKEIIKLKHKGLKTEPAFAKLLHLKGNPYQTILEYEKELF